MDDEIEIAGELLTAIELNRDGALPQSVKLCPISRNGKLVKGRDGREFLIEGEKVAKATNGRGLKVVLDCNHASYSFGSAESLAAYGWLDNLRVEGNYLVADLELTDKGKNAIESRHFRYLSPAFAMNGSAEVAFVHSVGLVNHPNLKLPALNKKNNQIKEKKEAEMPGEKNKEADPAVEGNAELLKGTLAENAELRLAQKNQEAKIAELEGKLAEQEKAAAELAVNGMLDAAEAEHKIAPAQREALKAVGLNSQEQLKNLLASMPVQANLQALAQESGPAGSPAGGNGAVSLNAEQKELAKAYGMSEEDYYNGYVKEAK